MVTERAVFRLEESGWVLTEVAPEIDAKEHILLCMDFEPRFSPELKRMDKRVFKQIRKSSNGGKQ